MFKQAVLLTVIFAATCHGYFPAKDPSWPISYALNCTQPGYFCSTCKEVTFCELQPDGSLVGSVADTCLGDKTCVETAPGLGQCTSEYNERCDPSIDVYKFVCQQPGVFPDPFDCTKYHVCKEDDKDQVSEGEPCPAGFSFDTNSMLCSAKLVNGTCTRPVKPCRNLGQGPIARNLRFYYSCRKNPEINDTMYFPFLYHCAGNFVNIDGICRDPALPQNVVNGTCTDKGLFYHPNCRQYNECVAAGRAPSLRTCSTGYYFDPNQDICVAFGCNLIL